VGDVEYVAWQCDQDAYSASGQKCSKQSILFVHENWLNDKVDLMGRIRTLAAKRRLQDLTIGPVLTVTTADLLKHTERLASIPGASLVCGGKELKGHSIPPQYGAVEPTAVFVPLKQILEKEHFEACTTEVFGPFQVITSYTDADLPLVLEACERMSHHLTAGIVSSDMCFIQKILGSTVNGVTYVGRRARTTGAPQWHSFGPAGDPRGAQIGTYEAIRSVWSCHREIVQDFGPVPPTWKAPPTM
jgi:1-pyrroline-5-carboxylate dehydrogenase